MVLGKWGDPSDWRHKYYRAPIAMHEAPTHNAAPVQTLNYANFHYQQQNHGTHLVEWVDCEDMRVWERVTAETV